MDDNGDKKNISDSIQKLIDVVEKDSSKLDKLCQHHYGPEALFTKLNDKIDKLANDVNKIKSSTNVE